MATATEVAAKILSEIAAPIVLEKAEQAVADGTHSWVFDPSVDGVLGLIKNNTNQAVIVVYVNDEDFECDEEWVHRG